ncbi:hypothetical protein PT974_05262 [Cladobotryum mycophilum]|uniref:EthD domain-containing protein n=1 Tax=Cladobotryum mycophilum TaxID=491253 RepID=A0ABR0SJD2_9HYPO
MAGDLFPTSHQRHYIYRMAGQGEDGRNAEFPANVILGNQADFGFDCITKFTFKDEDSYKKFFQVIMIDPENSARRIADEEKFMDNSVMSAVMIGDIIETQNTAG